ncbi:glycosyltransferase family 39 protein [uncultured Methanobrevibacter sp.]|uniref:glycosyltransferase family 39 protein n=1 Tax=uncultured Methanobrevibacter sp. TaxID=253161 RepID=UPI0025D3AB08|nr:glycosyltransferase family 39 protein [uncultured Methanobrevibacter sp.]
MKFNLIKYFRRNEDKISFYFIVCLFAIFAFLLILVNSKGNILGKSFGDVYSYLIAALRFSGVSIEGYQQINNLAPFIPFLTSFLFRLGFIGSSSIFFITGVFYFLGGVFFYKLLRLRFNNLYSILGAVLYGSCTVNLIWQATAIVDIPAVALSIIAIYSTMMAVDKNQKYFYIAFPVFVLAFLSKYSAALILPIMILYYILRVFSWKKFKTYKKNTLIGVILGIICFIPYILYLTIYHIDFNLYYQLNAIFTIHKYPLGAVNDLGFYFVNLFHCLNHIEILGIFLYIIFIFGIVLVLYRTRRILKVTYNQQSIKFLNRFVPLSIIYKLLLIGIILLFGIFLTAGRIPIVISEVLLFLIIYVMSVLSNKVLGKFNKIPHKTKYKFYNYDIIMFTWSYSYLIMLSAHFIKSTSYFSSMAPGFIALVVFSIYLIFKTDKLKDISLDLKENKRHDYNIKFSSLASLLLIFVFILSSFYCISIDRQDNVQTDGDGIVDFIKDNITHYDNLSIQEENGSIGDYSYYQNGIKLIISYFYGFNQYLIIC